MTHTHTHTHTHGCAHTLISGSDVVLFPSVSCAFHRPASHIVASYYQFLRLGRLGYTMVVYNMRAVSRRTHTLPFCYCSHAAQMLLTMYMCLVCILCVCVRVCACVRVCTAEHRC